MLKGNFDPEDMLIFWFYRLTENQMCVLFFPKDKAPKPQD